MEEYYNNTNPKNLDTDYDGLNDGDEIKIYFTSALNPDTDSDGFNDNIEVIENTDPLDDEDYPLEVDKEKKSKTQDYTIFIIVGIIIVVFLITFGVLIRLKKRSE